MIKRLVTTGLLIGMLLATGFAGAGKSLRIGKVTGLNESAPFPAGGGPLVLMGIDAEDGGPGRHGPISVYVNIVNSLLVSGTNGGSGLLVIGGGKAPFDSVTKFWDAIAVMTAQPVVYVNGDPGIRVQPFGGFALIAVVSSEPRTPGGGLTQDENDALATRASDVESFVNSGGALLGFTQAGLSNPYAYVAGFGGIINTNLQYEHITPTAEGLLVGITDELDVCCWHDEYVTFPSFLEVLATNDDTGNAAAIGGSQVMLPPPVFCCTDDTNGSSLTWSDTGEFSIIINNGTIFSGTGVVRRGGECTPGPVFPGPGRGRSPNCIVCFSGSYINGNGQVVLVQARKDTCKGECIAFAVVQQTFSVGRTITDTPGVGPDCPFQ